MFIPRCTLPTTRSYPSFNRFTHICLNVPVFQPMFTLSLTHVSPRWLNFLFLHIMYPSNVFSHSWNTHTTNISIIYQNKEIKNLIFLFPLPLVCIIYMASNELIIVQQVIEVKVLLMWYQCWSEYVDFLFPSAFDFMYCCFRFLHQKTLLKQVPEMISEVSGFGLSKCLFMSICVRTFKPLIALHNLNAHFRLKSFWVALSSSMDRALRPVMAKVRVPFSEVVCPLGRLHNYESHDCAIADRFWICGVTSFML